MDIQAPHMDKEQNGTQCFRSRLPQSSKLSSFLIINTFLNTMLYLGFCKSGHIIIILAEHNFTENQNPQN